MAALYDLVAMSVSSAPGTGASISLGAAATINGVTYLTFASAGTPTSTTVAYSILDTLASELGTAIYLSSGPLLGTRTPTKSTSGGAAINASSAAVILCGPRAEDIISTDLAQTFTAAQKDQASQNIGTVRAVRVQTFTANGTYTPDANLLYALIEVVGAGGAGGSGTGTATTSVGGGGGGSGSYSRKVSTAAAIGASQAVTVGTAGTGGAGNGGNGTDTSVGALCVGKGGTGGVTTGAGGAGGVAGTGEFTPTGNNGGNGQSLSNGTSAAFGGNGGGSHWGGAGKGARDTGVGTAGSAGTAYGSGGGGGATVGVVATGNGGNGFAGAVVITEFCSM